MGLGLVFLSFFQLVAVGAGTVFAVLLIIWFGIRRRSAGVERPTAE
jgi:hypothetical protein